MTEESILDAVELFERDPMAAPELADALTHFVETADPTDSLIGSAVWALGKRHDPALQSFFITVLRRTYRVNPSAGYQCLAVLSVTDPNILPGGGSVMEEDRNTRLAADYLERIETQQPRA
jgi:hypothetical protein